MPSATKLTDKESLPMPSTLSAVIALTLPAGLTLVLVAGLAGRRPAKSAVAGLGAAALAAVCLWACGFAFHSGGIGLTSSLPGLEGLVWEWASPLKLDWGVLGLRGFFLLGDAASPAALNLYLAILTPLTIAVALPLLTLRERTPGWMAALTGAFVGGLVFPMAGNWISGGGWLMHTGETLGMGHGYVDATGLSAAALVGGTASLLGILVFGRRLPPLPDGEMPALPPVHLPVLAMLGAGLVGIGAMALVGADPVRNLPELSSARAAVNLVLAAAGGALLPCLYTWFTTGAADSLAAARGAAAGVIAVAGAAPFVPPWAALATGAVAGLLVPLATFLLHKVLRIDDPIGAISIGLLGGVLGALAPGVFGDGLAGLGWNGTGGVSSVGASGQGVTGLLPATGFAADWPGQINAQLVGLAAIAAAALLLVGALLLVLKVLLLLWHAVPEPKEEG
jgi:Amt family ammonium transporter